MRIKIYLLIGFSILNIYSVASTEAASCADPINVTWMLLWVDADDQETIILDVSGNVQEWKDKSGNGNDLKQTSTVKRPWFKTWAINQRSSLVFSGEYINSENTWLTLPQPLTMFSVMKIDNNRSAPTNYGQSIFYSIQDDQDRFAVHSAVGAIYIYWWTNLLHFNINTPQEYSIYRNVYNATNSSVYKDGILKSNWNIWNLWFSWFALGRDHNLYHMYGEVSELLIFNRTLTVSESSGIESYLASKYSLSNLEKCILTPNLFSYIVGYGTQRKNVTIQNFNYGTARINNITMWGMYTFYVNFINNLWATTSNTKLHTPFNFLAPVSTGIEEWGTGNAVYKVKFFIKP